MTRASAHISHQSIKRDDEEHDRRGPDRARDRGHVRDAAVDAVPHEQRAGERADRVERDEQHADEQPAAVAPEEAQELEVGRGPALERDVDVRIGGRRAERVDLREQLGRGRERAAPPAAGARRRRRPRRPTTRTAAVGLAVRVRSAICALRMLFVVEAAPRRRA